MAARNVQRFLDDEGYYEFPRGDYHQDLPLFLGSGTRLYGGPGSSLSVGLYAGTTFEVARRRGLVSAGHWGGGYRTRFGGEETYVRTNGTAYDLGPPWGGFPAVRQLRVIFQAVLNDPPTWDGLRLLGIQANEFGDSGPQPAPWCLYFDGPRLTLAARTSDGIKRVFRFSPPFTASLSFEVRLDLDKREAAVVAGNTTYFADYADAGAGWASAEPLSFAENFLWPFSVGRLDPAFCTEDGWVTEAPSQGWPDATLNYLGVVYGRPGTPEFRLDCRFGGPHYPYEGGSPLPMIRSQASNTGAPQLLWVVRRGEQAAGGGDNVRIENLAVQGSEGNPVLNVGFCFGLTLRGCELRGGTRAVNGTMAGVTYPLKIHDCILEHQTDCNWFGFKPTWFDVLASQLNYAVNRPAVVVQGRGRFSNVMVAPHDKPVGPPKCLLEQFGGTVHAEMFNADVEYETDRPFAVLHPQTREAPYTGTILRLRSCNAGGHPLVPKDKVLVYVHPRPEGYKEMVKVTIEADHPAEYLVAGPGAAGVTVADGGGDVRTAIIL